MKIRKIIFYYSIILFLLLLSTSLLAKERIRMATTTSLENSGILYELLSHFEKKFKIKVDIIATGTGKALKLGENGDVDVVFVHDAEAEDEFIRQGFGLKRYQIMYNDFIVVGPEDDPAQVKGGSVLDAFSKIKSKKCLFVSRGDESGTHKKEMKIWRMIKAEPRGDNGRWYLETGQGMASTILIANEKRAYCLTDRATFIAYRKKVDLVILCEGDEILFNPYSIIAVNPKRYTHINYDSVVTLIDWLTSKEAQELILNFKKEGEALFYPSLLPSE
jgi:tungstate transport system substrate-binding protein